MSASIDAVAGSRVIQLGQLIDDRVTKNQGVPDFEQHLIHEHVAGAELLPGGYPGTSGAADTIFLATHSGTHMDSLTHIAHDGRFFDGTRIDDAGVQDPRRGVRLRTRENFTPIVSRGVLLDFAALLGVDTVPRDYVVTTTEIERCLAVHGGEIRRGDTVLIRTGWDTLTGEDSYADLPLPGPDADAARALASWGVVATGADTMSYEVAPGESLFEVHVELLVRAGIFIFEMMDLRELAESGAREFLFIAAPLRLRGGTASPVNPLAVLSA